MKSSNTFLGRRTRALDDQNWFAVGLEVVIVIVGVVIGFQVTEWGNERAARAEEQRLLRGLRAEFTQVVSDLEDQIEKHRRVEGAVAATLGALDDALRRGLSYGTVADTTLAWAYVATTTQFSQGILRGMLASGRLGLVRDTELRTALSEWDRVLADVTEDEIAARELVVSRLEPTLGRRMDVRPFRSYALVLGTARAEAVAAVSEVPTDLETLSVLAARLHWQQHTVAHRSIAALTSM